MKHLIVVAHPVEDSFTMQLAHAYTAELAQLGHGHRTYDLHRMGFNPVMAAQELAPAGSDRPASADVARAQEEIRAAEVLTVVYPLWWLSMPAMMKGFVDRVFARGFAYESRNGMVRGLLSGKKSILITLSAAPLPSLVRSGDWNAVQVLQDTHIFRSAGFELLEHLHFDQVVPGLASELADRYKARVRACVGRHFPAEQA
ncbi:MAG: NAD(P)H-dependent oxidoreductase [Steroidobacterales bacterium]